MVNDKTVYNLVLQKFNSKKQILKRKNPRRDAWGVWRGVATQLLSVTGGGGVPTGEVPRQDLGVGHLPIQSEYDSPPRLPSWG